MALLSLMILLFSICDILIPSFRPEEVGQVLPLAMRSLIKPSICAMMKIFRHYILLVIFELSTTDLVGRSLTSKTLDQILPIGMLISI